MVVNIVDPQLLGVGCHLLIVAQEPAILKLLALLLGEYGFTYRLASGGQAAVEYYAQHWQSVNVVLLDFRMNGMSGPATLQELQRINPDVRCLFMSGNPGLYLNEVSETCALGILARPFENIHETMLTIRNAAL